MPQKRAEAYPTGYCRIVPGQPQRLADWLKGAGHDVRTAAELGPDPGDAALLRIAAAESRILVTIDSDFGTLVYLLGAAHAGIIRLPDVPAAARITLMSDLLNRHSANLPESIVTIRGDRIRISRPPRDE